MIGFFRRNGLTILVLIILAAVIYAVVSQIWGAISPKPDQKSTYDLWFVVATIVLLAIAGASLRGLGGTPARWVLGLFMVLFTLKFLSGIIFGEKAPEVEDKVRKSATEMVLPSEPPKDQPKATAPAKVAPAVYRELMIEFGPGCKTTERLDPQQFVVWEEVGDTKPDTYEELILTPRGEWKPYKVALEEANRKGKRYPEFEQLKFCSSEGPKTVRVKLRWRQGAADLGFS